MRAFSLRAVRLPAVTAALILVAVGSLSAQGGGRRGGGGTVSPTPPAPAKEVADPAAPLSVEGYIKPPESIAHLVTAPRESNFTYTAASPGSLASISCGTISDGMVTLDQLGRPHYNLGGSPGSTTSGQSRLAR